MKKVVLLAVGFLSLMLVGAARAEKTIGSMVYFRSAEVTLRGYLYRPEGSGPFPGVVFVRSGNKPITESEPPVRELADFYTSRGFAFFVPNHRTAEELKAEIKGVGEKANGNGNHKRKLNLPEYAAMTKDIAAAVNWLKSQAFVNENRVAVIGQGAGAVGALLLSQQDVEVSGYILFSPASQNWSAQPALQPAMVDAIREAKAPILLIQAQNDFSLEPSQALGKEIAQKSKPSMAKVYPPFGTSHMQAGRFAVVGSSVWGSDVTSFLNRIFHL